MGRLAEHRTYKSGSVWAWWRWTDVRSEYLVRLHLIKTPWFAVCLHWLLRPDPEPFMHDHPVSFLSLVLRGWYLMRTPKGTRVTRWFRWYEATDKHTITLVAPKTITLCLMGPKVREWGFHTRIGWIMWKDYYAAR